MAIAGLPGAKRAYIGPSPFLNAGNPTSNTVTLDAANEAAIFIGRIETSDEGSHTINTSGSSAIAWRSATLTFADAGTTVKVGIAAVDTAAGRPARAANVADLITFDVSKLHTGASGTITASSWQSNVPDTGSKTIAHGDLVAVGIQMITRAGADIVRPEYPSVSTARHRPTVTSFLGGSYAAVAGTPNVFITFADGATGWIYGSDVSTISTRTWNSGSASAEYGQLYQFPFPLKVYGPYGYVDPDNDFDIILYEDPLGTPVAARTMSFDADTMSSATAARFEDMFSSPYTVPANTPFGMVYKPGASNISTYYKTLGAAGHRVSDPWGTSGYGISRASGAFANANSSLEHYYIGVIAGGFDSGGAPGPIGKFVSLQRGSPY